MREDLTNSYSLQGDLFKSETLKIIDYDSSYLTPLIPTPIFQTYWQFAAKRQQVYWNKLQGLPRPWSDDPILETYKFTNCYRVLDRVSQYLIKNVIENSATPRDIFFRTLLFKIFNKIETWELLKNKIGEPTVDSFDPERYGEVLSNAFNSGEKLYSAAYIMPSGNGYSKEPRKHMMHLRLLLQMIADGLPEKIAKACSMEQVFYLLKSYPTIGDFLAFQYTIDLNYSSLINFSEMDFVVAGPGAQRGIQKCFSYTAGMSNAEIIERVTETQRTSFKKLGLNFQNLWGRDLQLIDCQNLFCEIDKYTRESNPELRSGEKKSRIKQKYRPSSCTSFPVFPFKWKIHQPTREDV